LFWKMHRMLGALEELSPPADGEGPPEIGDTGEIVHAVVEPDADLLEWLHTGLSNRGIDASFFDDPDLAVSRLEMHGAKTLLLDTDGLSTEQLECWKRWKEESRTPVCAITGLADANPGIDECDAVLRKPFGIQDVVEAISQLEAAAPVMQSVGEGVEDRPGGHEEA
jgi:DNA-binding response OmpR family regulator